MHALYLLLAIGTVDAQSAAQAALSLTGSLLGAFVPSSQLSEARLPRIDAKLIAQANKQMLDAGPSELCIQSLARMRGMITLTRPPLSNTTDNC